MLNTMPFYTMLTKAKKSIIIVDQLKSASNNITIMQFHEVATFLVSKFCIKNMKVYVPTYAIYSYTVILFSI